LLALVTTLLVAVYVFGPTLVARRILDFVVPRRNLVQSKSEEILTGVLWSIIPLWFAWIVRHVGPYSLPPNAKLDLQVFYSGLQSDSFFNSNRESFFSAADSFWQLNRCVALRLYAIVLILALVINLLIASYGRMRYWLSSRKSLWSAMRWVLGTIVLPRISEWHVILSTVLLPTRDMTIELDILTKSGTLYKGRLADKVLAPSGDLQSITLDNPTRFRRDHYLSAVNAGQNPKPKEFWTAIPGNMFVVIASDIASLNVNYIPVVEVRQYSRQYTDIKQALKDIELKIAEIQPGRTHIPPFSYSSNS